MKASIWFLVVFFAVLAMVLALKTTVFSVSAAQVVLEKEAALTTEYFYVYVILFAFAVIVCAVLWYFNRVSVREKEEWKRKKLRERGKH